MHRKLRPRGRLLLGWFSAALLLGCAGLPTAPDHMAGPGAYVSSPQWVRSGAAPDPGRAIEVSATNSSVVTTKPIEGTSGGKVEAGRFQVDVPVGAYNGTGEISISVPDSNVLRVELHITGVPNEFREPVKLVVSWDGALGSLEADPSALQMTWFDEVAGKWVVIPSQVDLETRTIWTELDHFSEYGVFEGKAGW